jgi:hypothetical protein
VAAVNADGQHGRWAYRIIHKVTDVHEAVVAAIAELDPDGPARSSVQPRAAASPRLPRK